MPAYYNEIDPYAAQWLRNLIAAGHIAPGDVDERSIVDVQPDDLKGYTQCHFFAGIGGWSYAARLAGWPDDRELWTGSCPCQPFSGANKRRRGSDDARHLWPELHRLASECKPAVIFGEQVANSGGPAWLSGVLVDLEAAGFASAAVNLPACSVGSPQKRERFWFVAMGISKSIRRGESVEPVKGTQGAGPNSGQSPWADEGTLGFDGRRRRSVPGTPVLAHGIPARMAKLRAIGNSIVPQVAAEVIGAYMEIAA